MLRGALITSKAKHYAAILEPKELGGLLRAIQDYTGNFITRYALLIAPHVFVRPGELRHAEWKEIDLEEGVRSEEHTSELQSLMRISYAVFCLKKITNSNTKKTVTT